MPYTDIGQTWQKLSLISGHARRDPDFQFTSLAHLLNVEYLRDCYKSLNRKKAVGIDNVSWEEYGRDLDENPELLVSRLKRKKYKPMLAAVPILSIFWVLLTIATGQEKATLKLAVRPVTRNTLQNAEP